eukprot:CAMPEP_0194775908 /NCGR_PEP_ID=MMETSP0323_2-20130528/61623_1 /TAXON_ID=2866 ORGANISM="Crypthecodinium cohnii, Strain Seligo" /NCGR_SAMPLE_ID=MMETSP0323_2 /ASSEMBLY_ACC=CAM_ASM_000346 /LENGTH=58 /DNA_ID=CAMNT_0039712083 /DNA_START=139 /DNA_END=312 /DNA_ORIENTATION=+
MLAFRRSNCQSDGQHYFGLQNGSSDSLAHPMAKTIKIIISGTRGQVHVTADQLNLQLL